MVIFAQREARTVEPKGGARVFQLSYVAHELRHRIGRTLLTAMGLAAGVGLVIGIIGTSDGLEQAQNRVLAPLGDVGTDILVTRVVGAQSTQNAASPTPTPSAPSQQGGFFGRVGVGPAGALNQQDIDALLQENSNLVTDLAKLGKPGEKFTRDFFISGTLLSFPGEALDEVKKIDGVASATPGLTLLGQHQTGTVPEIVAELQTGGETFTTTVRPAPLTEAEQRAARECFARNGPAPGASPSPEGPRAFDQCLPERLREFRASVTTPLRTLRQIVDPPSTDITNTSYTAAGIDPATPTAGLVTTAQLIEGRWIASDAAGEILAAKSYATKNNLTIGSTIDINGTTFTVVGIVNPTLTGSTADLYFPLASLQNIAGKQGRITQVLVRVDDASNVEAVAERIGEALPGAQVVTAASLADQVTGSLADAKNLADRLGTALAVIVLAAAFTIAVLLTLSSIAKRVREIGTLRAIGWSKGRVVRQILAETIGIGLLGGTLGIAVGFAVAAAVEHFSPALTATTSGVPGLASSQLSNLFGQVTQTAQTSTIALTAPIGLLTLAIGVAFAVAGGLVAGAIGGWRAARLAPAEALRTVG